MTKAKPNRIYWIDFVRGITVINMILFHGMWDLVYMFGIKADWYEGNIGYIWQQAICWTFIFLSGFCAAIGKNTFKRGLQVFGSGILVSLVTILFLPEDRIIFGVLTLIGSCMLLTCVVSKINLTVNPTIPAAVCFLLFMLFKSVNQGYMLFGALHLPHSLYRNYLTTFFGFPFYEFYSTDYFSFIPWCFLYFCGYCICIKFKQTSLPFADKNVVIKPINYIGRHSLPVYLIHQVVLYVVLNIIFFILN